MFGIYVWFLRLKTFNMFVHITMKKKMAMMVVFRRSRCRVYWHLYGCFMQTWQPWLYRKHPRRSCLSSYHVVCLGSVTGPSAVILLKSAEQTSTLVREEYFKSSWRLDVHGEGHDHKMKSEGIEGCERFLSPGKGRGVRATKHFQVGDLVFACPAYSYVLTVNERGSHCEFCFTR